MTICNCGAHRTGYRDDQAFAHYDWCKTKEKPLLTEKDVNESWARANTNTIGALSPGNLQVSISAGHLLGAPVLSFGAHKLGRWEIDVVNKGILSVLTRAKPQNPNSIDYLFQVTPQVISVHLDTGHGVSHLKDLHPLKPGWTSGAWTIIAELGSSPSPPTKQDHIDLRILLCNGWRWMGWP